MIALLDVNVLIALVDTNHIFHGRAHRWLPRPGLTGWATCPITENGLLRIVGNPRYPGSPGSPASTLPALRRIQSLQGHVFWRDDLSFVTAPMVEGDLIQSSAQLTDTYLLALAVSKGGRLATFDRRLKTDAVAGGAAALEVIGD